MADQPDNPRAVHPAPRLGARLAVILLPALLLGTAAPSASAQKGTIDVTFAGTANSRAGAPSHPTGPRSSAVTAHPTASGILFEPAEVGVSSAAAQTLTAMFNVAGYTGSSYTPSAALHYGLSYSLATPAVTCSGGPSPETCSVNVTFQPLYPGNRPDALLLLDGTTVLSTVLIAGDGESPMALIQPGVVTQPVTSGGYYYTSVVGEDGTSYYVSQTANAVYSLTAGGVLTTLPITGLYKPDGIALDGAGTLYIAQNNYGTSLATYTAAGVQGTFSVSPPASYKPCQNSNFGNLEYPFLVTSGINGDLFVYEELCQQIFEFSPGGGFATTTLSPTFPSPYQMVTDSSENLFIGGYAINELTPGGVQTQVNTVGATSGIAVDAAETLYSPRYNGYEGVAELPASDYAATIANLDPTSDPLGVSLGSDGTILVSNYSIVDRVDRSQGALAFGTQTIGTTSGVMSVQVYNGGNQPLTLGNIGVDFTGTNNGFALVNPGTSPCSGGLVLAPGALCNIGVDVTPVHAGALTGNVDVGSNSLNNGSTTQLIALSANVVGIYLTVTPNPLNFPYQAPGTASAPMAVMVTNNGYLATGSYGGNLNSTDLLFSVPSADNGCTGSLAVGATCQLDVIFAPTSSGNYGGTISFNEASSQGGPDQLVSFFVQGTSMLPVIPINIGEAIQVNDADVPLVSIPIQIIENIAVADAVPPPVLAAVIPILETIHLTDTPAPGLSALFAIVETIQVTDTFVAPATIPVVETIHVTDTPAVTAITQTTPVITWATPAAVPYGTPLSATQLNATATVAGNFVYSPPAGTVLNAGPQLLNVVFTPTDTLHYTKNNDFVELYVSQVVSTINWTPATNAITLGQAIGAAILNATSTTPGPITYTASQGGAPVTVTAATVLGPGHWTLTATLTPSDPTDYTAATATQGLIVQSNPLTVTVNSASRNFATANPAFTYTITGFVGSDTSAVVSGAPVISTTAMLNSFAGSYPITATRETLTAPPNYTFNFVPGTLAVNGGAPQTITYPGPFGSWIVLAGLELTASSTSGLPITYKVLSGPGSIAGSFLTWSGSGPIVLSASQPGNATFAPAPTITFTIEVAP